MLKILTFLGLVLVYNIIKHFKIKILDSQAGSNASDVAAEDLADINVPADDESMIAPSEASGYRKKSIGRALFVSFRRAFLYLTRRVDRTGNNNWKDSHWLWWGNKLPQQYVISSYFKWFEERVSFAKKAQEMLNLRSVLPQQLIDSFQALLNRTSKKM
jgi:hypothetical protein